MGEIDIHCHICDNDSETVTIEHGAFTPCGECQRAIYDTLRSYPDSQVADPDDLVLEDSFDDVF